jgi:hypothetical protein
VVATGEAKPRPSSSESIDLTSPGSVDPLADLFQLVVVLPEGAGRTGVLGRAQHGLVVRAGVGDLVDLVPGVGGDTLGGVLVLGVVALRGGAAERLGVARLGLGQAAGARLLGVLAVEQCGHDLCSCYSGITSASTR